MFHVYPTYKSHLKAVHTSSFDASSAHGGDNGGHTKLRNQNNHPSPTRAQISPQVTNLTLDKARTSYRNRGSI